MSSLGLVALLAAMPSPEARLRFRVNALVGADSNPRLSSRNRGWVGLARTTGEIDYRRAWSGSTIGLTGQLRGDVAEGAEQGRAFGLGLALGWAHPSSVLSPDLQIDITVRYRLQVAAALGARSTPATSENDEANDGAEPDEIDILDGEFVTVTYPRPWNQLIFDTRLHYRASSVNRLSVQTRYRRSLRSFEPTSAAPHFHEGGLNLRWRHEWSSWLRQQLRYEVSARWFDARTDGRGGRRQDLVHRFGTRLRGTWSSLRIDIGYGLRWLDSNRARRDSLRHSAELTLRYPLVAGVHLLARADTHDEVRSERPERDWSRARIQTGLEARF